MESNLDESLRLKYLDTDYIISDDPPLLMRIGEQSDDLRVLLGSMGVESAAFITAWNPQSEQLTDDENDDRQAVLLTDIEKNAAELSGRLRPARRLARVQLSRAGNTARSGDGDGDTL